MNAENDLFHVYVEHKFANKVDKRRIKHANNV